MTSESNEPSQQDIIEAQLHLLLAGRDHLDVTRALQNVLHKHQKQIAVMSLGEAQQIEHNLVTAHNEIINVCNFFDGRAAYTGHNLPDVMRQVHDAVKKTRDFVTYARNQLAHSTYDARKYANPT